MYISFCIANSLPLFLCSLHELLMKSRDRTLDFGGVGICQISVRPILLLTGQLSLNLPLVSSMSPCRASFLTCREVHQFSVKDVKLLITLHQHQIEKWILGWHSENG